MREYLCPTLVSVHCNYVLFYSTYAIPDCLLPHSSLIWLHLDMMQMYELDGILDMSLDFVYYSSFVLVLSVPNSCCANSSRVVVTLRVLLLKSCEITK